MKNYIFTLTTIVIITLAGCQKMKIEKEENITYDQIRTTTTYLETKDGYDVYIDGKGQKILIPNFLKSSNGGVVTIGGNCDKKLEIAGSPGCYYYICENPGRTCKKLKGGEIRVCGGCID